MPSRTIVGAFRVSLTSQIRVVQTAAQYTKELPSHFCEIRQGFPPDSSIPGPCNVPCTEPPLNRGFRLLACRTATEVIRELAQCRLITARLTNNPQTIPESAWYT